MEINIEDYMEISIEEYDNKYLLEEFKTCILNSLYNKNEILTALYEKIREEILKRME